jgi:hypothetical protein
METKDIKCPNGECDGNCCKVPGCCEQKGSCPEHDIPEETMSIEDKAFWDSFSRGDEKRKQLLEEK